MKNLKKVLALVVVFTMVLTVAFASYPDVDNTADYAGAVELLSSLDILKGDDAGNFNPDQNITRAEYAAVVCRALGLENSANGAKGATMFTDVAADHWATGYINLASQQGIVNGMGDGTFEPESNVTYAQAVKMLVVAMGYEPMAAQRGGYPSGYLSVANSIKLTAGVSASGNDTPALRSTVAMLTANAMEIAVMDQTGFGTDTKYEVLDDEDNYESLLTRMDIYVATGVVGDYEDENTKEQVKFKVTEDSDDFEFVAPAESVTDKFTKKFYVNGSNIADYKNQSVKVYVEKASTNKYYVKAIVAADTGDVLDVDIADIDEDTTTLSATKDYIEYYENADATKTTKLYIDKAVEVYVNGSKQEETGKTGYDLFKKYFDEYKNDDCTIAFVENTDDKYYDVVKFVKYDYYTVDEVDANREKLTLDATTISFEDFLDDSAYVIAFKDADGNDITLADFNEDDVVAVVSQKPGKVKPNSDNKEITFYNLGENTITGTVDGVKANDNTIVIDGKEYDVVKTIALGSDKGFTLSSEGTYYLTMTGKIYDFDGTKGSNGKYGYILDAGANDSTFDNGLQVKILTTDMGVVVMDAYTTFKYQVEKTESGKTTVVDEQLKPSTDAAKVAAFEAAYKKDGSATTAMRLVKYKTTSDNYIKSIEWFDDVATVTDGSYKDSTQKLGGKLLADNVVVFVVDPSKDIDDAYATSISTLVDDTNYSGVVADKDDSEYCVMAMTEGDASIDVAKNISVVKSVGDITYNGDDVTEVVVYSNNEEKDIKLIFNSDSKKYKDTDKKVPEGKYSVSDINTGSVILYTANADGVVSYYIVLGVVDNKVLSVDDAALNLMTDSVNSTDYSYAYGYINDIEKNSKGKIITLIGVNGKEYQILTTSNKYTYEYKSRNAKIYVDDYQGTSNVDVYDEDANDATFVFFKLADEEVVDVYTFDARKTPVAGKVSTPAEEVEKTTTTPPSTPAESGSESGETKTEAADTKVVADEDIADIAPVEIDAVEVE